jgi:hypothetical protein
MFFSRLEGQWYCAFFDEGAMHNRLPCRLTCRDSGKVNETARRGNAHLENPATCAKFQFALASEYGKIWLHLTCEQRSALEQAIAD